MSMDGQPTACCSMLERYPCEQPRDGVRPYLWHLPTPRVPATETAPTAGCTYTGEYEGDGGVRSPYTCNDGAEARMDGEVAWRRARSVAG
jgi:hypothetical protein